jgi:hypothetical protein
MRAMRVKAAMWLVMACVVLVGSAPVSASVPVGGLTLENISPLKPNRTFAQKQRERLRAAGVPVETVDAYEGDVPWASKQLAGTVYVVRTRLKAGAKRGLDAVVQETFDDVVAKYGDKAGVLRNERTRVGGNDAHRLSFSVQEEDVSVGAEILLLQNKTQDTLWYVQIVFNESAAGPKGAPDKAARRQRAADIVESARFARPAPPAPGPAAR